MKFASNPLVQPLEDSARDVLYVRNLKDTRLHHIQLAKAVIMQRLHNHLNTIIKYSYKCIAVARSLATA